MVFNAMCLYQVRGSYSLVLSRVILGSLGLSHTSESALTHHHCMARSISAKYFYRRTSMKMFISHPPILDPPIERETRWDVLALDTIGFWEFKEIINTQSRISFYLVRQSNRSFKITDRPHHHPCLHHQPMMNLSSRDSAKDLLKFYS
jgi:hypothetical protein